MIYPPKCNLSGIGSAVSADCNESSQQSVICHGEQLYLHEYHFYTAPPFSASIAVGQNLFRTANLIGLCWPEALLFQNWGSLLVLF